MNFNDLKIILKQYDDLKKSAIVDFVMSHADHKKGDLIENNGIKIVVDKISVTVSHGKPLAIYKGRELKKDGEPRKDGRIAYIFGKTPCKECESVDI